MNRDNPVTLNKQQCVSCGKFFTSSRSDKKTCSDLCRKRLQRHTRRNERAQNIPSEYINMKRPIIRYYGSKWRLASWIIEQFPPHVTFVEPFCGAANILFRKEPSKFEVINDLNGDIVNFFDVLRSRPNKLIRLIELTPHSREEHKRAHQPVTEPLERARRFYIRSWQSYGSGEGKWNTGWRYQQNDRRGSSVTDEWNDTDRLWLAAARLKQVQIECDTALRVIKRFDTPQTLFYVDPPYLFSTRYSTEPRYAHEMSEQDHIDLAESLHLVNGLAIISGYHSELYTELYRDWRCISKATRTNDNHAATEYLWISPAADSAMYPLFQTAGD